MSIHFSTGDIIIMGILAFLILAATIALWIKLFRVMKLNGLIPLMMCVVICSFARLRGENIFLVWFPAGFAFGWLVLRASLNMMNRK